jgi:hypothetical protein
MQDNGNTAHEPERASPEKSQPREAAGVQRQKAGKGQATQEPRVPREDIRLLVNASYASCVCYHVNER